MPVFCILMGKDFMPHSDERRANMTDNNVYSMSQPCNEYMMYTVPMYIAFMIGYYVFRPSLQLSRIDLIKCCSTAERLSTILICIGLLFIFYILFIPFAHFTLKVHSLLHLSHYDH